MKTSLVWVLLPVVAVSTWSLWMYQKNKTAHVNYLQITTSSPALVKGYYQSSE